MKGFLSPRASVVPKISLNCCQLAMKTGVLAGPLGAKPTNAAVVVLMPSMGRGPLWISST